MIVRAQYRRIGRTFDTAHCIHLDARSGGGGVLMQITDVALEHEAFVCVRNEIRFENVVHFEIDPRGSGAAYIKVPVDHAVDTVGLRVALYQCTGTRITALEAVIGETLGAESRNGR